MVDYDNVLVGIAIFVVIASVGSSLFVFYSVNSLLTVFTGYATSGTGEANLTIRSEMAISIPTTDNAIEWGEGRLNSTRANLNSMGWVRGGNWTATYKGFIIQNIGNANVNLSIKVGKSAASFLGGTLPVYQWNVSNNKSSSCTQSKLVLGTFTDANASDCTACYPLSFVSTQNSVRVDINISFAEDAASGTKTDTLTATATAM